MNDWQSTTAEIVLREASEVSDCSGLFTVRALMRRPALVGITLDAVHQALSRAARAGDAIRLGCGVYSISHAAAGRVVRGQYMSGSVEFAVAELADSIGGVLEYITGRTVQRSAMKRLFAIINGELSRGMVPKKPPAVIGDLGIAGMSCAKAKRNSKQRTNRDLLCSVCGAVGAERGRAGVTCKSASCIVASANKRRHQRTKKDHQ